MNIELIDNKLNKKSRDSILRLTKENVEYLDVNTFTKGTALYDFMAEREAVKIGLYLDRLEQHGSEGSSLLISKNELGEILGYLLFLTGVNTPAACSIIGVVVRKQDRKKGTCSALINDLKSKYSAITLSCKIELVTMYEKLGFNVTKHWFTQVAMSTDTDIQNPTAQIITISDEYLTNTTEVQHALKNFCLQEPARYKKLLNKMQKDSKKEVKKAKAFVQLKLKKNSS